MRQRTFLRIAGLAVAMALIADPAWAHEGGGSGFWAGFTHPIGGLDHVLAMVAVGMWGALLGPPALWALPIAFPLVMSIGGIAGILGLPVPKVELGIAISVVVLGAMIAFDRRPSIALASVLVAFFAIFHGYAHGAELPSQVGALAYCVGFVVATGLLHLSGILIGFVTELPHGLPILRAGGSAIALVGIYLTWQAVAA
jgi:urease accessory protein